MNEPRSHLWTVVVAVVVGLSFALVAIVFCTSLGYDRGLTGSYAVVSAVVGTIAFFCGHIDGYGEAVL